jgi:Domain of unknown function (DUF4381)
METTADALRDIHGLDAVGWFPPAAGWWYLLGLVVAALLLAGIRYWLIYYGPWLGWRGDARRQLRYLKKALAKCEPREIADQLSELLRRIAMARSGRREAAGITGDAWLLWIEAHDDSGFDWQTRGKILLVAPYMPPAMAVHKDELAKLIRAALRWVDAVQPAPRTQSFTPARLRQMFRSMMPGVRRV